MTQHYPCPGCHDEVAVTDEDRAAERTTCHWCGLRLHVETDAEQVDGRWRDATTLRVVERGEPATVREITERNGG